MVKAEALMIPETVVLGLLAVPCVHTRPCIITWLTTLSASIKNNQGKLGCVRQLVRAQRRKRGQESKPSSSSPSFSTAATAGVDRGRGLNNWERREPFSWFSQFHLLLIVLLQKNQLSSLKRQMLMAFFRAPFSNFHRPGWATHVGLGLCGGQLLLIPLSFMTSELINAEPRNQSVGAKLLKYTAHVLPGTTCALPRWLRALNSGLGLLHQLTWRSHYTNDAF